MADVPRRVVRRIEGFERMTSADPLEREEETKRLEEQRRRRASSDEKPDPAQPSPFEERLRRGKR